MLKIKFELNVFNFIRMLFEPKTYPNASTFALTMCLVAVYNSTRSNALNFSYIIASTWNIEYKHIGSCL